MSSNVSVALITALATLSGVAVTGTITLLTSRLQTRDLNAKEKRQLRRDTYVAFLDQATLLDSKLEGLWNKVIKRERFTATTVSDEISETVKSVERQLNLISLEGPESVAEAAHDLQQAQLDEALQIMMAALEKADISPADVEPKKREARERFIKSARNALT